MGFDLRRELGDLIRLLREEEIDYAICGGLAVAIHGYPRATKDMDIMIREQDVERVEETVKQAGFNLSSGIIPFDSGKPTERRILRISKTEGEDFLTLDLILVGPFLEDVWAERESIQIEDEAFCVVSLQGLLKMKRAAGRAVDLADIKALDPEERR